MHFPHKSEEDSVEKEVVVAVNGLESKVVFIDHQHGAMKLENLVMTYDPHAFLVVLAVDDTSSLATVSTDLSDDGLFDLFQAERLLAGLVSSSSLAGRATILVANKTDLVRLRISSFLTHILSGNKSDQDKGGEDCSWEAAGGEVQREVHRDLAW